MAWSPDTELHQMFLDELDQRCGRLASAAGAMAAGDTAEISVGAMRREGHTIKGTARVMGYEAVGAVAEMIEQVWDGIGSGAVTMTPQLGEALARACVELELAGRDEPVAGTIDLRTAARAVADLVADVDAPELADATEATADPPPGAPSAAHARPAPAAPEATTAPSPPSAPSSGDEDGELVEDVEVLPPSTVAPSPPDAASARTSDQQSASRREPGRPSDTLPVSTGSTLSDPGSRREPPDLPVEYGGVIGAIEAWASEGTVIVNAGRLYRLINRITATRAETAALDRLTTAPGIPADVREMASGIALAADALQSDVLGLASLPLSTLTSTLPQLVKYLSKKLGKNVELEISGDRGVVIDRQVLEAISDPVRQLIVNAIYHGLEIPARRKDQRKPSVGSLTLDVTMEGNMLEIVVTDDGEGVNWDDVYDAGIEVGLLRSGASREPERLTPLLFERGFTTGSIDGGRGDGLAKLASVVDGLHGRVQFETWPGEGTRVTVRVPAWQALHRVLIVRGGGMRWALPEAAVEQTMSAAAAGATRFDDAQQMEWEGKLISVMPLAAAAGAEPSGEESSLIIVSHRVGTAAVAVDAIDGSFEVAVTELAPLAAGPDHVTGVALLGGGEVALVVDAGRLVERTRLVPGSTRARARVLVVDDSEGGRAVLSGSLSSSGFATSVAGSAAEALSVLEDLAVDALVVDYSLPSASGVALVEEVRRRDRSIPIVMISARASEEDQVRAKKAGVDRYFDKSDYRDGVLTNALWELLGE